MNKFRADFDYIIIGDIIVITDLNYGNKSVTNDIENVIHDIDCDLKRESGHGINQYKIMYQDSRGIFDEILVNDQGYFKDFRTLNEKTFEKAKLRL